uniref:Uncharacterized protein n=1 Tax=Rhizophora mucronata TaxID=61149 RepID=A0A2P2NUZ7_RHIMU
MFLHASFPCAVTYQKLES